MLSRTLTPLLILAVMTAVVAQPGAEAQAGSVSLTPTYGTAQADATTGDNFIAGKGWYVDPGADSHIDDPLRERPLDTNSLSRQGGEWVHPGKYYSFLDIESATWGYDDSNLYFKMTLFGKASYNDAFSGPDFGTFASGTLYNILFSQRPDGEANGGIRLSITGDETDLWTGAAGKFDSKATEAFWDENGDVGDSGITTTKEDGDSAGNGFEETTISSDGKLGGSGPVALWGRINPGADNEATKPTVEIALNYLLWNQRSGLPDIDPAAISLLIFETDRGIKDNANYLWNDKYTIGEEGSPYQINDEVGDPITQLGNIYELDRLRWVQAPPPPPNTQSIPLPGAGWAGLGLLLGLAAGRRLRWRRQQG